MAMRSLMVFSCWAGGTGIESSRPQTSDTLASVAWP